MTIRLDNAAPAWATGLVNQINQRLAQMANPQAPVRVPAYPPSALPDPTQWTNSIIRVTGIGLAYSDGDHWRRTDTNAAI